MQGIRKALVDPDMKASVERQHRQEINFWGGVFVIWDGVFGNCDGIFNIWYLVDTDMKCF